ncbi:3'-5' exoribonuclease domain-containing protein [Escherichia coli]
MRRSDQRQAFPARGVTTTIAMYAQSLSWGKAIDFDARTAIPFEGERHNALYDARYQAKYVSVIWQTDPESG